MSENQPPPQRHATRASIHRPVRLQFDDAIEVVEAACRNISIGGMFILSKNCRPAGSLVRFELDVEEGAAIRGLAEVVWMRSRDGGPGHDPGMGVKFRFLEQRDRQQIFKLVSQHIKDRLATRTPFADSGLASPASAVESQAPPTVRPPRAAPATDESTSPSQPDESAGELRESAPASSGGAASSGAAASSEVTASSEGAVSSEGAGSAGGFGPPPVFAGGREAMAESAPQAVAGTPAGEPEVAAPTSLDPIPSISAAASAPLLTPESPDPGPDISAPSKVDAPLSSTSSAVPTSAPPASFPPVAPPTSSAGQPGAGSPGASDDSPAPVEGSPPSTQADTDSGQQRLLFDADAQAPADIPPLATAGAGQPRVWPSSNPPTPLDLPLSLDPGGAIPASASDSPSSGPVYDPPDFDGSDDGPSGRPDLQYDLDSNPAGPIVGEAAPDDVDSAPSTGLFGAPPDGLDALDSDSSRVDQTPIDMPAPDYSSSADAPPPATSASLGFGADSSAPEISAEVASVVSQGTAEESEGGDPYYEHLGDDHFEHRPAPRREFPMLPVIILAALLVGALTYLFGGALFDWVGGDPGAGDPGAGDPAAATGATQPDPTELQDEPSAAAPSQAGSSQAGSSQAGSPQASPPGPTPARPGATSQPTGQSSPPPPSVVVAPPPSAPDSSPPPPPRAASSSAKAFSKLEDISWRATGQGLQVTLKLDGIAETGRVRHFRLEGPARAVVRLIGVSQRYGRQQITVGQGGIGDIRVGWHRDRRQGPELHIVFDLNNSALAIQDLRLDGQQVVVSLAPG